MDESTYMLCIIAIAAILFGLTVYGNYIKRKKAGLVVNIDEFFKEYSDQICIMAEQAISIFDIKRSDFTSDEDFMKHIIALTTDIVANSMDNFGFDITKYPAMKPIIDTMIYKIISENLTKYITLSNELSLINDIEDAKLESSDGIYSDIQKSLEEKIAAMPDKNNS